MEITKEMQESYVKLIDELFGGAIRAYPEQINEEVIEYVQKMTSQLTECHMNMAIFAVTFQTIANTLEALIPSEIRFIFGSMTFKEYVDDKGIGFTIDKLSGVIASNTGANNAKVNSAVLKFMFEFTKTWVKYTKDDRRLVMCINTARVNWRSKIQIALLEL